MSLDLSSEGKDEVANTAWNVIRLASSMSEKLERAGHATLFRFDKAGQLKPVESDQPAVIGWSPDRGWQSRLSPDNPQDELLDLYLPICSSTTTRPTTIGHLGQSLDGFIATHSGDSQFVTGNDNIVHLHRMRALCNAVIVGAGTVAADDPQLTTRHVTGLNPLRVIFDPTRRLHSNYRVFTDGVTQTLYVCAQSKIRPGETMFGNATIAGIDDKQPKHDLLQLVDLLHARGCSRLFVEGGGVTVSAFLEVDLLDRLHIAIAPLLIGDGRPAIRMSPHASLRDCLRPGYRVFRMGGDVLFDCDLKVSVAGSDKKSSLSSIPPVTRII